MIVKRGKIEIIKEIGNTTLVLHNWRITLWFLEAGCPGVCGTHLTKTFGSKRFAVDLSFNCVLLKNLLSVETL